MTEGADLDWATAEALAFGSLLYQGTLSGVCLDMGLFVDLCSALQTAGAQ